MDAQEEISRNTQYAALCHRCKTRLEPPSRREVFGQYIWLHDSVVLCDAHDLREQHRKEDQEKCSTSS